MIKFKVGSLIGLGLSDENIRRLRDDQPILVKGVDLGIGVDIMIFTGATEGEIVKRIAPFIGVDTVVHGEPEEVA